MNFTLLVAYIDKMEERTNSDIKGAAAAGHISNWTGIKPVLLDSFADLKQLL